MKSTKHSEHHSKDYVPSRKAKKTLTSGKPRKSGKADDDTAAATNSACWPSLNASIADTGAVREEGAAYLSAEVVKALAIGRKESGKDIGSRASAIRQVQCTCGVNCLALYFFKAPHEPKR